MTDHRLIIVKTSRLVLFVSAAALAVGCASSNKTTQSERPLTFDEATQLASVQKRNYDDQGAVVRVSTAFTGTGDSMSMEAEIDWPGHQGHGVLSGRGMEEGISEVFWVADAVLERRPALNVVLRGRGFAGVEFVARPPETDKRLLDRAVAVVVGLASKDPDNALLVQQKTGSAFLRNDVLRGKPVVVLRYGERNIYWLDQATGEMLRFEGNAAALTAPIIVDVLERGKRSITFPLASAVTEVGAIKEIYETVTQRLVTATTAAQN